MKPSTTNGALYGKGIFTTIAFRDGKPLLWEKHWSRLAQDAEKLGIDISNYDEPTMRAAILEAVKKYDTAVGRVRMSFADDSTSNLWGRGAESGASLSIVAGAARKIALEFRITLSPYLVNTTSPLAGIKSCNYLEPLMAIDEAKKRGFDEAIRLNERGAVTSACMANLFWLKDERLHTPSPKTGCLAGTTREFVIENLECEEVEAGIEALQDADEIFLTSAGIGVVQVAAFDGRKLRSRDHPIKNILPF